MSTFFMSAIAILQLEGKTTFTTWWKHFCNSLMKYCQSSLNKAFMPKTPCSCVNFPQFLDFSVHFTQRPRGRRGATGGRWDFLCDVTEAAFDWLGLKYCRASAIGSQLIYCMILGNLPPSFASPILFFLDSTWQNSEDDWGVVAHLEGPGQSAHMTSPKSSQGCLLSS